jgi:hypothetical protein
MLPHGSCAAGCAFFVAALLGATVTASAADNRAMIEEALSSISMLPHPEKDGYATAYHGNKYVQCRRMPDRMLLCESAGVLMQPSLARVLVAERLRRLFAFGWRLDSRFGNYVQSFPPDMPLGDIADRILLTLKEGYDADMSALAIRTDRIKSEPCPPRNGPSQNLAGMINDDPMMAPTAVRGCAYVPGAELGTPTPIRTKAELIDLYGAKVAVEVQRLRNNMGLGIYFVVGTGAGYVQCRPRLSPPAIYCELQSAESRPALRRILTADRVATLHAAGYEDPGYSPNFSKTYPADQFSNQAIADELLTLLFEVYGYDGAPQLKFQSEKDS